MRVLAGLLPFGLAGGLVYFALLRHHDINYYLARRPAEFWVAAVLVAALLAALLALLVRTVTRWAFALPIVLFEDVAPRRALGESRRRSEGDRGVILSALAAWGAIAALVLAVTTRLPEAAGRYLAPHFGGTLAGTLTFVLVLAIFSGLLALAAGVVNVSLFSLLLARLYLAVGEPKSPRAPGEAVMASRGSLIRAPPPPRLGGHRLGPHRHRPRLPRGGTGPPVPGGGGDRAPRVVESGPGELAGRVPPRR